MNYDEIAKKYGAVNSVAPSKPGAPKVDYSAIASKFGGVTSAAPAPQSQPQPAESGGVGGFLKSIVSAPATIIARPLQAIAELAGASAEDVDKFSSKYSGGLVAPVPHNAADVKKDVGRAVETVALGTGAPIAGGAAFGVGSSLEQGNDLFSAQTALQGVLGAGAGKALDLIGKPLLDVAGKVIGTITPKTLQDVASKGSGAVQDFMARHEILSNEGKAMVAKIPKAAEAVDTGVSNLFKGAGEKTKAVIQSQYPGMTSDNMVAKAEQQLKDKYVELFEGQSASKQKKFLNTQKATEMKNAAGTEGTPPQETLAKAHIIPEQKGSKLATLEQADRFRKTAIPLQEANRSALAEVQTKTPKINLIDQEEKAVSLIKTPRNINEGTAKSLEKEIRSEYEALRSHYGNEVPITVLDDIKSARWKPISFDKVDSTRPLLGDANYAIAKTAQRTIEDTARSVGAENVAQLNRHIGDIMEGAKYLEGLNNKNIKGSGFSKFGIKAAGFMLGNSIPAKIAGYLGGDLIANMMIANEISGPVQRMILKNIENKEGPAALQATIEYLTEQKATRATQLALPAPKTPSEMIKNGGVNVLPPGNKPIPLSYPQSKADTFGNDLIQNNRIFRNTKMLPAPEPRIITPNTQGTPNRVDRLYESGGDKGQVGGIRQRLGAYYE